MHRKAIRRHFGIKEDLFGYDRYRIPCKYLTYSRIDLDLKRPVTLPSRLYKAGRDPLEGISYSIQSTKDTGHRVLRRSDSLNMSKSMSLCPCYHPVPITRTSTNHLLPWVYPSVDCRLDFIDTRQALVHNPYFSSLYYSVVCALSCRICLKSTCINILSYESY